MNQAVESNDDDADDDWFRPVWADLPDETDAPRPPPPPAGDPDDLLVPLADAADALARLDAQAALLSPALHEGLLTRLVYAEAAGRLAAAGITVHPWMLALRDSERLGRHELAAHAAGPADPDAAFWAVEDALPRALQLARLLRRTTATDPFASLEAAQAALAPLGRDAGPFDAARFARFRAAHWPDGRRPSDQPALLRAAAAAVGWMESGVADQPDPTQGLLAAHGVLRRTATLRVVPLPFWAGWAAVGAPLEVGALPRLRGDVVARLTPDGAAWSVVFLQYVAEAARAGSRTLANLRQAAAAAMTLATQADRRSRLPALVEALIRQPATAAALAREAGITPQAVLRLLVPLRANSVVAELTGRGRFRAFALAA